MSADNGRGAAPQGATGPPAGKRSLRALRPPAVAAAFRAAIGVPLTGAAYRATARAPASASASKPLRRAR
jgi:hypothetical protein